MLVQANTQPHRGNVLQLILMQFLIQLLILLRIQLGPFLLHFLLFLWTFITANVHVDLIGHNTIVAEFYRFMEPKTVAGVFGFLQFELHDDPVEVQNVELFL